MKRIFFSSLIVIGVLALVSPHAHATTTATSFSIESVGGSVGLGNADLKTTVINILNWLLGILALVAVTMIIASVVVAATNSERAEAAKKTITGAVIGLIIVLLAWAIVLFVANTTSNVTATS